MSDAVVADLLADLIDPARFAWPASTAANPANPANREQPCGPAPDSRPCESLQIAANRHRQLPAVAPDSQAFAEFRNLPDGLESKQRRGFSQDSQDSQPAAEGKASQRCADCLHLLRRGTCGDPVAAGLLPAFGIVWPDDAHAYTCQAFSGKAPAEPSERPYRLTKADADRCHAPEWQDVGIARYSARVQRFARLGVDAEDADDLAERLALRDRDDDNRVMCAECSHYRPGRCGNPKAAGLHLAEVGRDLATLLQRCPGFETAR